jgi:hypothetical protein
MRVVRGRKLLWLVFIEMSWPQKSCEKMCNTLMFCTVQRVRKRRRKQQPELACPSFDTPLTSAFFSSAAKSS